MVDQLPAFQNRFSNKYPLGPHRQIVSEIPTWPWHICLQHWTQTYIALPPLSLSLSPPVYIYICMCVWQTCRQASEESQKQYLHLWNIVPSGNHTWRVGKFPNWMEVSSQENHLFQWSIFQPAMFDYRRVIIVLGRTPSHLITLWWSNIATENGPFIVDLPII